MIVRRIIYGMPAGKPRWRTRVGTEGGSERLIVCTYGFWHTYISVRILGKRVRFYA